MNITIDYEKLITSIYEFEAYVKAVDHKSESDHISFTDSASILRDEWYKRKIANKYDFKIKNWSEKDIDSDAIAKEIIPIITDTENNLINKQFQKPKVTNILRYGKEKSSEPDNAERKKEAQTAIYNLFKSANPGQKEFDDLKDAFGGNFDVLAFFFYIKDSGKYLPFRSVKFDEAFHNIGIETSFAGRTSWETYSEFIKVITIVRDVINQTIAPYPAAELIDAHSFVWITNEDRYKQRDMTVSPVQKKKASKAKAKIEFFGSEHPERRDISSTGYVRDSEVIRQAKLNANGVCQLCNLKAPFLNKSGEPYLEVHHIIPLSDGGSDTLKNAVALCPNCHAKMHHCEDTANDIKQLLQVAKRQSIM